MELKWTSKALPESARLHEFLARVNEPSAARAVQALVKAPTVLLSNPRIGEQLFEFAPREARRLLVGHRAAMLQTTFKWRTRYFHQGETLFLRHC